MPGWSGRSEEEWLEIAQQQSLDALPQEMQDYVAKMEELTGIPAFAVSIGPRRESTITIKQFF
jgi:adenylosuccinate synthase